ncbi:MAG: SRPBCC domain-containing protein [Burkholderiales bacterium]
MIEVNERIEVASAPRTVWSVLSDPHAVVECVSGASLGDQQEDGSYDATLVIKFGPTRVTFQARFALELDPAAMTGRVIAKGKDSIGGTRVQARMTFSVVEQTDPPGSAVPITSEVEISGRLASLIEGGAKLVVKRMVGEFTGRLAERCAAAAA